MLMFFFWRAYRFPLLIFHPDRAYYAKLGEKFGYSKFHKSF